MKVYSAPAEITAPELDFRDIPGYTAAAEQYLADVQKWARDNVSGKSDIAGSVVAIPYADGHAVYVIAKLERSHGLIHIDTWDGWRSPGFENYATVSELRDRVARSKRRAAFDAARSAA